MATKGWASPEAEKSSARTTELRQRLTIDFEQTWYALRGDYLVHLTRLDLRKAVETAAQMIARAEERGSARHVAQAETWLAMARMFSGDLDLAAQCFERAWALLESIAKPATGLTEQHAGLMPQAETFERIFTQATTRGYSALNLWLLGHPDRALERLIVATAIVRESGQRDVLAEVHILAATVHNLRGELEHVRLRAEAAFELATEGNPYFRAQGGILLGWADAMAGDLDGGIARMRCHLLEFRATGAELATDSYLALIATALGQKGECDEGLRTIDESLAIIERTGARASDAEVHRLKGELLMAQEASNAAQAEQSFRTALEISRKQNAKSLELRATTSLARLLGQQGRRDEARAMLTEIYGWFSEGFDTADLKDAKALLKQLDA